MRGALSATQLFPFLAREFRPQIRLVLDRKDYVRAQILSKKITPNAFQEKGALWSLRARCEHSIRKAFMRAACCTVKRSSTALTASAGAPARSSLSLSAAKKEGEIEQRIRDSTVAPPLEGTPTIPELKLSYYRLMIRYHMVRRRVVALSSGPACVCFLLSHGHRSP